MGTYVIIERDGTTSVIDAIGIKKALDIYFKEISTNGLQEGFSIHQATHEMRNSK